MSTPSIDYKAKIPDEQVRGILAAASEYGPEKLNRIGFESQKALTDAAIIRQGELELSRRMYGNHGTTPHSLYHGLLRIVAEKGPSDKTRQDAAVIKLLQEAELL